MSGLSDRDRAILAALDLAPAKREQVARELRLSVPRFNQAAVRLLRDPAAEVEYPQLVRRWQRIMDRRREVRHGIDR